MEMQTKNGTRLSKHRSRAPLVVKNYGVPFEIFKYTITFIKLNIEIRPNLSVAVDS